MLTIVILGPIVSLVNDMNQHTYVTSHADEHDLMLLVVKQVSRLGLVTLLSLPSPVPFAQASCRLDMVSTVNGASCLTLSLQES